MKNQLTTNQTSAKNEIVVYQPNETMRLEVRMEDETVWLAQSQMAELFGCTTRNVRMHLANVYACGELDEESTRKDFFLVRMEGARKVSRVVTCYDLDAIISVGYRVNSVQGVKFRRWATSVLREYLLRGYSFNTRLNQLEDKVDRRFAEQGNRIVELEEQVDYFVKTSLPPKEKVFVDGKMLDAQVELTRIVKTARRRIVLIDKYIDERTLMLLGNRRYGVSCKVYTYGANSPKLAPAVANYVKEYPLMPIEIKNYKKSHDRFLVVDNTVWHIGASLKDAGSALFAMMRMELDPSVILSLLP